MRVQLGLVLVLSAFAVCAEEVPKIAKVRKQLAGYYANNESFFSIQRDAVDSSLTKRLLTTQKPDGSWGDVDYKCQQRGNWATLRHLARTRQLAAAWQTKPNSELRDATIRGLGYWAEHDFTNPNWWYQSIGTPIHIAETVILLDNDIPADLREKLQPILSRSKVGMTGQNKVWVAGIHAMKGILNNDEKTLKEGRDIIASELVFAPRGKEGLQPDFSFHQHGAQLQFGNYGLSYFADAVKWTVGLRGTEWAFGAEKEKLVADYYRNGLAWTLWNGAMDISACARQIGPTEPFEKYDAVMGNARAMGIMETPVGHRYFPYSDYMVWRGSQMMVTVKMSSKRVIGCETVNDENLQGAHGGNGVALFYTNGDSLYRRPLLNGYVGMMPLLDWRKLPGVTALQDRASLRCGTQKNTAEFVGGVSDDEIGFCAMELDIPGLKAKKSYFTFNGLFVAMGSGITSDRDVPVFTTVDQRRGRTTSFRRRGHPSYYMGANESVDSVIVSVYSTVLYRFMEGIRVFVETKNMAGRWGKVIGALGDRPVSGSRLLLGIDHGVKPRGEGYFYCVGGNALNVTRLKTSSPDIHALALDGATMVSFFVPGTFTDADGSTYVVDKPMLMMLRGNDCYYADPTGKLKSATLILPTGPGHTLTFNAEIPGGTCKISIK